MKSSLFKKHSFWFLFGAVPLLVGLGVIMIISVVDGATAERMTEYENQKKEIAAAKPKGIGVGNELSKQKGELDTKVTALWGENYLQQKNAGLYKWPATLRAERAETDLAKLENLNLPFGDEFKRPTPADAPANTPPAYYYDNNQTEFIEFASANVYLKAFRDMAESVFPTRFGSGGPGGGEMGGGGGKFSGSGGGMPGPGMPSIGGVGPGGPGMPGGGGLQNNLGDGWQSVLRHVTDWGSTQKPTVPEFWLALEDIWVQRELLAIIARTNHELTKFEPQFTFWNYSPFKRTFVSRLWTIDLEVIFEPGRKYLKTTLHNKSDRLQLLGAGKVMRLKVWLDNPKDTLPSLPEYIIGGELVPGHSTLDVVLQKTDPRNVNLPGLHAIPQDRPVTRIAKIEQILDDVSVPVKVIQAVELGVTDHRRGAATLLPPKIKGLIEDPPADAASGTPGPVGGTPQPGSLEGGPGVPGKGGGGIPGGAGGVGGAAAAGARTGTKEAVLTGNKLRYLEVTDQVRRMPVALSVVLDGAFVQDLLVQFTNSKMRFQVTQVGWQRFRGTLASTTPAPGAGRPGPGGFPAPGTPGTGGFPTPGMPGGGIEGGGFGGIGGASNQAVTAQANAGLVTLAIYGVVSLYSELPLVEIKLDETDVYDAPTNNFKDPAKATNEAELEKLIPDAATRQRIKRVLDPRTHDLLMFTWEGPPDDQLTFTVAEQAAKFGLAPGAQNSADKVQHRKLYAIRRTLKWSVE